eukprot:scaffold94636_cov17-Prasinocladus_malaysianus.AAC.2
MACRCDLCSIHHSDLMCKSAARWAVCTLTGKCCNESHPCDDLHRYCCGIIAIKIRLINICS